MNHKMITLAIQGPGTSNFSAIDLLLKNDILNISAFWRKTITEKLAHLEAVK